MSRLQCYKNRIFYVTLAMSASMSSGLVTANGFYVDEQSVLHLGMAFSGTTTRGEDASSAYYNPASLRQSSERKSTINLTPISSRVSYEGDTLALAGDPASPAPVVVQGQDADINDTGVLPAIYLSIPVTNRFTYGFALNAPFNTETQYGLNSVARYQSVSSAVRSLTLTNSVALDVTSAVSFGVGLVAQATEADLVQAVNPAVVCLDGDEGTAACNGAGIMLEGQADFDGLVDLEGDDVGFGINMGITVKLGQSHLVGLNYRSKIDHTLDGRALVTAPISGALLTDTVKVDITTPATTTLGYQYTRDKWAYYAEASLTQWSDFDELAFKASNELVQPFLVTQRFNWKDSSRFAIGAEYQIRPSLALRAGLALDQSPISDQGATVDLGQKDYQQLGLGLSYQAGATIAIDLGYLYSQSERRQFTQGDIQVPDQNLSSFTGTSDYTFHSVGAALRITF